MYGDVIFGDSGDTARKTIDLYGLRGCHHRYPAITRIDLSLVEMSGRIMNRKVVLCNITQINYYRSHRLASYVTFEIARKQIAANVTN